MGNFFLLVCVSMATLEQQRQNIYLSPCKTVLKSKTSCKMSMATNYRYEVERPGAKNLRKALKRQESRIKVGRLRYLPDKRHLHYLL